LAWITYSARFSIDDSTPWIHQISAWTGHRQFAYDLVRFLHPKTIVELGTHCGASFFSFCQAIKDAGMDSQCHAVDTWQGDPHTGGYAEDIYQTVAQISASQFPGMANLIRSTFDEAVHLFSDDSIDLLHIDGYHTLQAVSHDYSTWLPKLAPYGVVLFHDIAVRTGDFGVHQLWDFLKQQFLHLEFQHYFGLGVLFPKGCNPLIAEMLAQKYQIQSSYR
jgi:predicted O-methyltransferase YrrM